MWLLEVSLDTRQLESLLAAYIVFNLCHKRLWIFGKLLFRVKQNTYLFKFYFYIQAKGHCHANIQCTLNIPPPDTHIPFSPISPIGLNTV